MNFRDLLRDVIITVAPIDFSTIVVSKRTDENGEEGVFIESFTDDRAVIMKARALKPVDDITGIFGITNLGMLQGMLGLKIYNTENTTITPVVRNGAIERLQFKSDESTSDFLLVSGKFIKKQPTIMAKEFAFEVTPSAAKIAELKSFAGVFKTVSKFITPYAEDNTLYFKAGNANKNLSSGFLAFEKCEGSLKPQYGFDVDRILQAVSRINSAKITMKFNERGLLVIRVDTGIVEYDFILSGGAF